MTATMDAAAAERQLGGALSMKVRRLRNALDLSLDALAQKSGLSKGTVVAIEQGTANPSIGVLCRLAAAFSISVTDLLGETTNTENGGPIERTMPAILWHSPQKSEATLHASTSGRTMFELWSWTIAPGDVHRSEAHSPGTLELIAVTRGALRVTVGKETILLKAGEAARLVTDQAHTYEPAGSRAVSFSMAVLEQGQS